MPDFESEDLDIYEQQKIIESRIGNNVSNIILPDKYLLPKKYYNYNIILPILINNKNRNIENKIKKLIYDDKKNKFTPSQFSTLLYIAEREFQNTIYKDENSLLLEIILNYCINKINDINKDKIIQELKCIGYYTWKYSIFQIIKTIDSEFKSFEKDLYNNIFKSNYKNIWNKLIEWLFRSDRRKLNSFINYLSIFINLIDYIFINYNDAYIDIDNNTNTLSFGLTHRLYSHIIYKIEINKKNLEYFKISFFSNMDVKRITLPISIFYNTKLKNVLKILIKKANLYKNIENIKSGKFIEYKAGSHGINKQKNIQNQINIYMEKLSSNAMD